MKQLQDDKICKFCFGCNKLELEDFNGVKSCNGFIAAYKNWQYRYLKALKRKEGDG